MTSESLLPICAAFLAGILFTVAMQAVCRAIQRARHRRITPASNIHITKI